MRAKGYFCRCLYVLRGRAPGLSYERLFKIGYKGIRQMIVDALKDVDKTSPDGLKKYTFLKAELLVNEAATDHIKRYATLAWEKAKSTSDETRKKELIQMHENLLWISENPPRTFWEAIQLVHIANCMIHMECNGHSISYGRFDQYMYPLFKKDIKEGTATREFCQE
jgi:formate C-acetyltransferase